MTFLGPKALLAVATAASLASSPAQAITFDFFWTGDPSVDTNLTMSGDPTASALGTLEIDAMAGDTFGLADVVSVNIAVTGDLFTDFNVISLLAISGTIAADGLSASLVDIFTRVPQNFGCDSALGDCGAVAGFNITIASAPDRVFTYTSTSAAQQSFVLTAVAPIPLPAGLPLLLAGLGGFAILRRARRTNG
ncbi:MAG: VPLPA-CTERM sorting domain-containing protein [Pseudomonadota bacterium]